MPLTLAVRITGTPDTLEKSLIEYVIDKTNLQILRQNLNTIGVEGVQQIPPYDKSTLAAARMSYEAILSKQVIAIDAANEREFLDSDAGEVKLSSLKTSWASATNQQRAAAQAAALAALQA